MFLKRLPNIRCNQTDAKIHKNFTTNPFMMLNKNHCVRCYRGYLLLDYKCS